MLVTELIRRGALYHGERIALRFGDESRTFREVDRLSNRVSHTLTHGLGLGRGSPIALLIDNGLDSVPCDFGCAKAGLTRTPLNGLLSRDEHRLMLGKIGAGTMIYGPSQAERAAELKAELPELRVLGLGDASAGADLLALARDASDADPRLPLDLDDDVLALFTSGTTGTLKAMVTGVTRSYSVALEGVRTAIDPAPGETMLHAASMIHASGCFVIPYWLRGGTAAVLPGFAPGELTVSLGVCVASGERAYPLELMSCADAQLYRAKITRNCVGAPTVEPAR